MDHINPMAGKIGKPQQVLFANEASRLKAAHMARGSGAAISGLAPTIQRIAGSCTQSFGVVDILVSGKVAEDGLSQHSNESMPAILARARISEHLTCQRGQPKGAVKSR